MIVSNRKRLMAQLVNEQKDDKTIILPEVDSTKYPYWMLFKINKDVVTELKYPETEYVFVGMQNEYHPNYLLELKQKATNNVTGWNCIFIMNDNSYKTVRLTYNDKYCNSIMLASEIKPNKIISLILIGCDDVSARLIGDINIYSVAGFPKALGEYSIVTNFIE